MRKTIAVAVGTGLVSAQVLACDLHLGGVDLLEPVASPWPELTLSSTPTVFAKGSDLPAAIEITDPLILAWKQNLTGVKGTSTNATINATVSTIDADVRTVGYTISSVYVRA